ncbi:protein phosphatase 1 regulatory subunit 21 isoform X1 [Rhizophagus clarus]|uniref:Protein phosphatase 1 regulatory subunit 21 isoform X1 n=1 Tax=Rhizophagus clarus TaxID=94130 RepID=A0A8H3QFQ4_9GLOM|nr:protein phosphatase 1 regulatory subunit 21 isoform X1 [Rhizophagus clarus]
MLFVTPLLEQNHPFKSDAGSQNYSKLVYIQVLYESSCELLSLTHDVNGCLNPLLPGRISASASLHSSGATSTEELAEKYQKLFSEFSRIKAQHSVLKKAVRKEQVTNASLQEECKTKEQELRTSLQQLDLLNFHNERLTKRIQSLQDSGNAKLSTGWLLGSTKKEIEKLKASLEARSIDLTRKIEENEKLHKELYEVNSLYTQHVNVLQSNISELEKKKEELQLELTRSYMASEEALSTMRLEKREVEVKLEETKRQLQLTNALMEKNEQKLKEDDDVLRAELNALRQTLLINLGLADGAQSEQLNILSEKMDTESNEIIESFKYLQHSTREYLNSLKENPDSSYELSIRVKNASQVWQRNLQTLAVKFTSAQSKISELTTKNEILVKANETGSNKVSDLESKISRLSEELDKQKISSQESYNNNNESLSEQSSMNNSISNPKLNSSGFNGPILKPASQNDEIKEEESGPPKLSEDPNDSDDDVEFVYPVNPSVEPSVNDNKESTVQPASAKSTLADDDDNVTGNGIAASFLPLERDMSGRKDDDAKQRENLIKKHYECKITQLTEQLQLADSKATRFYKALETLQSRLAAAESKNAKLQKELANSKEIFAEERKNHENSVETMQKFITDLSEEKENLINQLRAGPSNRAM